MQPGEKIYLTFVVNAGLTKLAVYYSNYLRRQNTLYYLVNSVQQLLDYASTILASILRK